MTSVRPLAESAHTEVMSRRACIEVEGALEFRTRRAPVHGDERRRALPPLACPQDVRTPAPREHDSRAAASHSARVATVRRPCIAPQPKMPPSIELEFGLARWICGLCIVVGAPKMPPSTLERLGLEREEGAGARGAAAPPAKSEKPSPVGMA